jgi:Predicted methyltransferase regulatory domain
MHARWRPLYVTEVRAAMATIGLVPVGSTTLIENFDRLVLSDSARETLACIADPDLRELARDFFLDQRLRCDVFDRGNRRLDPTECAERLLASPLALGRPAAAIRYTTTTPAGARAYDTPTARRIVAALAAGPRSLSDLGPAPELLENALTLCAAGDVMPVEPGGEQVARLNRAIWQRLDGPEEIRWLALPCGTALETDRRLLRSLSAGAEIDDELYPGWRGFLASHGVFAQ